MDKTLTVTPPEGYIIDYDKSSFHRIVFKKADTRVVTMFENLDYINGFFVSSGSEIMEVTRKINSSPYNKNLWPTKELAEAALALSQLMQLRYRMVGNWNPEWIYIPVYVITVISNKIKKETSITFSRPLSFPSKEMRDNFYDLYYNLIEEAKPLL